MSKNQTLTVGFRFSLSAIAVAVMTAGVAHAHGIPLKTSSYEDNQLYGIKLVAYDPVESQIAVTDTNLKGAGGFYPDPDRFPFGRQLTVDAAGSAFHSAVNILLPLGSPVGLYAIGFQVTSPGSPAFGRSETFWGVANNGMTSPGDVQLGLDAIQAAVPEPSSIVLAALGAAALVFFRWRRSR